MVHIPVMVTEVVKLLLSRQCNILLDGTVGCGGHAEALLSESGSVRVIGVDRDRDALQAARDRLSCFGDRVTLTEGSYSELDSVLRDGDMKLKLDGVLLDLGLSSLQLDDPGRGFSYQTDGPLDMRMGGEGEAAKDLIATMAVDELAGILKTYGETRGAKKIARAIKKAEHAGELETTHQLKKAIEQVLGHPASPSLLSKVFQAVRIAVNDELRNLRLFLDRVFDHVHPGARLVFISYHSLEDREIKQFLNRESARCICSVEAPICTCDHQPRIEKITRRAQRPNKDEIAINPRARSAHLRAARVL